MDHTPRSTFRNAAVVHTPRNIIRKSETYCALVYLHFCRRHAGATREERPAERAIHRPTPGRLMAEHRAQKISRLQILRKV